MTNAERPTVAIAGATGFVGQALRRTLVRDYEVIGLTRSPTRAGMPDDDGVRWRHCDLFSISGVETALQGVDFAFYLVHSMMPSARLTQASFVDLDLLLADNFARAAEANGVKQVLYVGGILPENEKPSAHLQSRHEVELTLAARGTPVTGLRAGLIVGPGGSSFAMLVNLVRRLPAMLLPAWTRGASSPIAIEDVLRAAEYTLGRNDTFGRTFDIGGPEVMTYQEMLERTSSFLGLQRPMIAVPLVSPGLSNRWVTMVTGASSELVGPLIESLRYSLTPDDNPVNRWLQPKALSFETALEHSLKPDKSLAPNPRRTIRPGDDKKLKSKKTVRSVQRLPLPAGRDARWVAHEYMRWLPSFVWPFLVCQVDDQRVVRFKLRFTPIVLLELTYAPERSSEDRQLFRITGGILARVDTDAHGRLEFREVLSRSAILAAIHDFRPALPWYVYSVTQAVVHLWVMKSFGRHLASPRLELSSGAGPEDRSKVDDESASRIDTV